MKKQYKWYLLVVCVVTLMLGSDLSLEALGQRDPRDQLHRLGRLVGNGGVLFGIDRTSGRVRRGAIMFPLGIHDCQLISEGELDTDLLETTHAVRLRQP